MVPLIKESCRDLGKHFIFKGRSLRPRRSASVAALRRRDAVREQILSAMKDSLMGTEPKRVLDVGTGFGVCIEFLAKFFRQDQRLWSVDPSSQVLREVRAVLIRKGLARRVRFKEAKAEALPFPSHHFDVVVSFLTLHHLSRPAKGLREMYRVLAKNGLLIVSDWKRLRSPVVPHAAKDIPSKRFVAQSLRRLGCSTSLHQGRYWYAVEATK